jgi:hypothetical protein
MERMTGKREGRTAVRSATAMALKALSALWWSLNPLSKGEKVQQGKGELKGRNDQKKSIERNEHNRRNLTKETEGTRQEECKGRIDGTRGINGVPRTEAV